MAQKVSVCRRNAFSWQGPEYLDVSFLFSLILSLGHTRKFIPPPWYKGVGGGGCDGTPGGLVEPLPGVFDVAVFRNDFAFNGKPLIFSTR